MKYSKLFFNLCRLTLVFLTLEILLRRWIFHQLPSAIPAYAVYLLILINLLYLRCLHVRES